MSYEDILFQNPGPTNIPSRVFEAMRRPAVDHRGSVFNVILDECLEGLAHVLQTSGAIVTYAASGHGAWEAALVNVFSPGDKILALSMGYFGRGWVEYARRFGLDVVELPCDPRHGVDDVALEKALQEDSGKLIKGVLVTHCETSTGAMTDCVMVRRALDAAKHPALMLVDVISSLGSAEFQMDAWGVDVAVAAGQKGLMLPTGLCFTGISEKALEVSMSAKLPRAYWDWRDMLSKKKQVNFPGTAPVHMFFGLQEALRMIFEEGVEKVIARHHRLAEATRAAVDRWAAGGAVEHFVDNRIASPSITAILFKTGGAEAVRATALRDFKVQVGGGLAELKDKQIRIGHMGQLSAAQLMGALSGVEMALKTQKIEIGTGALEAAAATLAKSI